MHIFSFWLFGLMLYVPVNSYGPVGKVSSPNNTFYWESLTKRLTSTLCSRREDNGRRNYFMISAKVWDRAGVDLATPRSAVRHVTDCATRPGTYIMTTFIMEPVRNYRVKTTTVTWCLNLRPLSWVFKAEFMHVNPFKPNEHFVSIFRGVRCFFFL